MKGSLFWKFMYVCCAFAGMLAGYGVFSLTGVQDNKENIHTKDNTLLRESEEGVFFSAKPEGENNSPTPTVVAIVTSAPAAMAADVTAIPAEATVTAEVTATPADEAVTAKVTAMPQEVPTPTKMATTIAGEEELPSLGSRWIGMGTAILPQQELQEVADGAKEAPEEKKEEDITQSQVNTREAVTYPVKIFGQTPVINRSDTYVSYFEFCYDLIAIVELEVAAKGLNLNSLLTKFALKALLCGVDIETLDINAPIPRRMAALCLWLAAQVLRENGWDTSSQSAEQYVTDISGCSSAEKKAVAYLYEQGIIKGYQISGQKFYPAKGLQTETGAAWILGVKKSWK